MSKQKLIQCPGCGEPMEVEWRDNKPKEYCEACAQEIGEFNEMQK
jgi:hypothetical protein